LFVAELAKSPFASSAAMALLTRRALVTKLKAVIQPHNYRIDPRATAIGSQKTEEIPHMQPEIA
jgi:hypothetical protein